MKFFILISVTLFLSVTACCQDSKFGFFGGPQASTAFYSVRGQKQSTEYKYGFRTGIGWKIPFDNHLYFSPEIFYSLKGYKVTLEQSAFPPDSTATDNNTTIHCLETAPLLQIDLSNQPNHYFIKFGPSLDIQLLGHEKFHLQNGDYISRKMKYDFPDYGRFGINFIGQFGYESQNGLIISAQYSLGITNINNADFGPNIKHRVIGISVGKYFELKKKKIVMDTRNRE